MKDALGVRLVRQVGWCSEGWPRRLLFPQVFFEVLHQLCVQER
jgi:hypothetical protein